MSSDQPAFVIQGLHKSYRLREHHIEVLRGVDLTVARGEWVSLVGASGSGKTTLLHLLATLDRPTAGRIECFGQDYAGLGPRDRTRIRRHVIGLVFQNYHLFPELSAVENAVLPAARWGTDRGKQLEAARALLENFGLGERFAHRPQELSGGEQQRVAMARALINDPDIVLADEPTGNLDGTAADRIMAILQELHEQKGKTIVMVTHDQALAERGDRVLHLEDGRIQG